MKTLIEYSIKFCWNCIVFASWKTEVEILCCCPMYQPELGMSEGVYAYFDKAIFYFSLNRRGEVVTFWIQQAWDAQLVLGQWEGVLQILFVAPPPHHLHVHQVWADGMDHRVERHPAPPTSTKVLHFHALTPWDKQKYMFTAGRWQSTLEMITQIMIQTVRVIQTALFPILLADVEKMVEKMMLNWS